MNLTAKNVSDYRNLLNVKGEGGLYEHVVVFGTVESSSEPNVDVGFLDLSEAFLTYARKTEDKDAYNIAKILKRAANTLYRKLLKQNPNKKRNNRFLNVV